MSPSHRGARCLPSVAATLIFGLVAACGGGGDGGSAGSNGSGAAAPSISAAANPPAGGSSGNGSGSPAGASISANVSSVAVSAYTSESAPTATIGISGQFTASVTSIYVGVVATQNGIASLSIAAGAAAVITLTFKSPADLGPGAYQDTVKVFGCLDSQCAQPISSPPAIAVTYTVTLGRPQITSVSPDLSAAGGSGTTLQINGSGFTAQSVVEWYGAPLPTTYVKPTQLTAQIGSTLLAAPAVAALTVANPSSEPPPSGLSLSAPASFVVAGVAPASVPAGDPGISLSVIGEDFTSSSVVQWNGSPRSTTFVSANVLRAQITAADIATPGTAAVAVTGAGGSASAGNVVITSTPASKDAVAFQIDPQHSGATGFNAMSLPAGPAWSVDVGGAASFALIAAGKVFVTSRQVGGGALIALDQATGATVWGPIDIAGTLNVAYDNGRVFVSNGVALQAYDAQSGALSWTAAAPAGSSFAALAAADGMVFVGGENGTGMTAYLQSNGFIAWQQLLGQTNTNPTVTLDGLYVGDIGYTDDLDPYTGDLLWQNQGGPSGGHNVISAAVNGILYSGNTLEVGTDSGTEFDAESGVVLAGFNAYFPAAIGTRTGYFLTGNAISGGTLSAVDLASGTVLWTFTGDGQLQISPILVGPYVFIASTAGNLYALDATSGSILWQQNTGGSITASPGWNGGVPLSGLSAGDGLLVVPVGTKVTAYVFSTNP